ncbi:MAG TPA: DNA replication/repair protein RecF [Bacteroidia bacterium]|nr:DNA replication/repair protein RecF [Bacteroidia bacterium]
MDFVFHNGDIPLKTPKFVLSMQLRRLHLINFKNHEELVWQFTHINCITGPNGAGKTNVLDAIHYLSLCKSYFNSTDLQNIRHEEGFFMCAGNYDDSGEAIALQLGVKRNVRKTIKKNGAEYDKLAQHIGLIPLVIITPFDIQLVYESGEGRRRFMDTILSQTDASYLEALQQYNRLLDQRNRQLKQFAERNNFNSTLLETYNQQLAPLAQAVYKKRKDFFSSFIPVFREKYALISDSAETAGIDYESQLHQAGFLALMEENLRRDTALERTTAGPHRDDLDFTLDGRPVKRFASQGQTKSFVIALKLAQYEYLKENTDKKPLLLLDDIFEKLDALRAAQLMELVAGEGFGQLFITDTHRERLRGVFENLGLEPSYFHLGAEEAVTANP